MHFLESHYPFEPAFQEDTFRGVLAQTTQLNHGDFNQSMSSVDVVF